MCAECRISYFTVPIVSGVGGISNFDMYDMYNVWILCIRRIICNCSDTDHWRPFLSIKLIIISSIPASDYINLYYSILVIITVLVVITLLVCVQSVILVVRRYDALEIKPLTFFQMLSCYFILINYQAILCHRLLQIVVFG